ncbi:MAG TPA: GAF domain-containing protein [Solirubrobacteraceae bacterium]|nr:GAF domain-containing protein [Solirubrobacteraceae bacterium]
MGARHLALAPAPTEARPPRSLARVSAALRRPLHEVAELTGLTLATAGALVSLAGDEGDHVYGAVAVAPSGDGLAPGVARLCRRIVATAAPICAANVSIGSFGELGTFAGVPLTLADEHVAGALAVVAAPSRIWTPLDIRLLAGLAARAATEIQLALAESRDDQRAGT